jgi:hypothetical protein
VAEIIIENHCISPTKNNTYTQIHTLSTTTSTLLP